MEDESNPNGVGVAMLILNEEQQLAITFISAANRQGCRPSVENVEEWIRMPGRVPARRGRLVKKGRPPSPSPVMASFMDAVLPQMRALTDQRNMLRESVISSAKMAGLLSQDPGEPDVYGPSIPQETLIAQLVRLGWISQDSQGSLTATPLGIALLRNEQQAEEDAEVATSVVLDSNDSLAYPRLFQRLAEAGAGMVVDPYIRVDEVADIERHTAISRILIGSRVTQPQRASIGVYLRVAARRAIEVRIAQAGDLHDRMIISDDFVDTIGTSFNTVGRKHPTILSPLPTVAADLMRSHAEKWWDSAEILYAVTEEDIVPVDD